MPLSLTSAYPWTNSPLIVSAPMRLISLAPLAVAVSNAGGLGFLAAGTDIKDLKEQLQTAAKLLKNSPLKDTSPHLLPIGVGFINWGVDLETALVAFQDHLPAAVWFFAPEKNEDLISWSEDVRRLSGGRTKIWIQVGTVADALHVARICCPDVLVIQGVDAGGHGLAHGAGVVSLLPEVADALREAGENSISLAAAGGIVDGRGVAACLSLGANGVVLGTRFLASKEATITKGYQSDVLRSSDGGISTIRTSVYDMLRGTTGWPTKYNGRGIINLSFLDVQNGKSMDESKKLYEEALRKGDQGWGENGRLTTYAGSGVGLVREVKTARDIVEEVRRDAIEVLSRFSRLTPKL